MFANADGEILLGPNNAPMSRLFGTLGRVDFRWVILDFNRVQITNLSSAPAILLFDGITQTIAGGGTATFTRDQMTPDPARTSIPLKARFANTAYGKRIYIPMDLPGQEGTEDDGDVGGFITTISRRGTIGFDPLAQEGAAWILDPAEFDGPIIGTVEYTLRRRIGTSITITDTTVTTGGTVPTFTGGDEYWALRTRAKVAEPDVYAEAQSDWVLVRDVTTPTAPATLVAADINIIRSDWLPDGDGETWFTPFARFPGINFTTYPNAVVEWCAAPDPSIESNWHPCVAVGSTEPGVFRHRPTGYPLPAGTFDASLFTNTTAAGVTRMGRMRYRWAHTAAGTRSAMGPEMLVPAPVDVDTPVVVNTTQGFPLPSTGMMNDAVEIGTNRYDVNSYASRLTNQKPVKSHGPFIFFVGAFLGDTRSFNGQTALQHAVRHMKFWLNSTSTTANGNAPAMFSGYTAQYELPFVSCAALALNTPALLSQLTTREVNMLGLLLRGALASSGYVMSDTNDDVVARRAQGDMRGHPCGRGWNGNFRVPCMLTTFVAAAALTPRVADAFLSSFNRADFAAEINDLGGMYDMWNTFRRDWTAGTAGAGPRGGPTAAQLQTALRGPGGGRYQTFGFNLSDANTIFVREMDSQFGGIIRPGYYNPNIEGDHGINEGTLNGGRGIVARIITRSAWAGLPNAGQVGQMQEFDTSDGDGLRSSPTYNINGTRSALCGWLALALLGYVSRTDPDTISAMNKMRRGIIDFRYKTTHGYEGYSKGGRPNNTSPNETWNASYAQNGGWLLTSILGMGDVCLIPWFFSPVYTVRPAIPGTPRVGVATTATGGTWLNSPTLSYRWFQLIGTTWTLITGATGLTYTPVAGMSGRRLRLEVTAGNNNGTTVENSLESAIIAAA